MEPCCYPDEYGDHFDRKRAESRAKRFRKRGLVGTAGALADAVAACGIEGGSVLEVGGGVGELQIDLMRRGAARVINVDLSGEYEVPARALLDEHGFADRADRRVGDFVVEADTLPVADAVVLHRVVCCYPFWDRMLAQVVDHADRIVGLTFPHDRWWNRAQFRVGNAIDALRGSDFRAFVHPADQMLGLLSEAGFSPTYDRAGFWWRTVVLQRAG